MTFAAGRIVADRFIAAAKLQIRPFGCTIFTLMPRPSTAAAHPWAFPARFRAHAFGWKGTKLATERLKEALSEIKAAQKQDPVLAAEGAVRLIEKLVPAIQDIDSSSGSLGTATNRALETLVDIIAGAPAVPETRTAWLDRLWEAYAEDGYGYLDQLPDRWGELCAPSTPSS